MSHKLRIIPLTCMLLCVGSITAAKADTVTFTGLALIGQMSYTEAGMTVASANGLFGANTGVGGSRNLVLILQNTATFTFAGAAFNALSIEINVFADNGPGLPPNTATFRAFNGANLTGTFTLVRNPGDPQPPLILNFAAGFQGITSLVVSSPVIAGQVHVDNFTFQPAQAVPEPTTMILLASGLAGLATKVGRRRRDQKRLRPLSY